MSELLVGAHGVNRYWERQMRVEDWELVVAGDLRAIVLLSYQSAADFAQAASYGLTPLCRLTNDGGWGTPRAFYERHRATVREVAPHCRRSQSKAVVARAP